MHIIMEKIKYYKEIGPINPVMIAGWPGMGSVALGVVDYLQRKLKAVKFAEIPVDPLSVMDSVMVEDALASFPPPPTNIFYFTKNPDMIIFRGEAQLPGREGVALLNEVLELALKYKVRSIYTGAAFPVPESHKEAPQVYVAVNKGSLKEPLLRYGIHSMDGGHISGLNGLVLGFAERAGIDAACFLATMPQYAISLPNPKAASSIIEVLQRILGFRLDFKELNEYIKDMDEKMAVIEDKVKDVLTIEAKEAESPKLHTPEKKIPPYITKKIEVLFKEAAVDKTKAISLKEELDRWDLYKAYEDRFLDLFRK